LQITHSKLLSKSSNNVLQKILSSISLPLPRRTPAVGWNANSGQVRKGDSKKKKNKKKDRSDRPFDLAFFGAPLPLFFLSSISCSLCFSAASTSPISGNWRMMEESEMVGG